MKKAAIAIVLAVFVAALVLFISKKESTRIVAESAPPVSVIGKAHSQPATAIADMSLPMPLGLTGDPVKGRAFFMGNCFTCHGVKGDGNGPRAYFITPPPRDFLLETSRQRLNRPVLFEAIANGRLGTNMPAWGKVLTSQDIADVAEFVFENFIHPAKEIDASRENSPSQERKGNTY
ncbi:MAG TPA: cytochrome c [Gallionella sp.]|nr:cytochrome c [Gallionella sp.]